ncbi:MAG: exodeoxyribonuclease V subunit gamma [Tepidimonas ignava]|nr:exodeoxyribonuclease V subunit gamma [Tepidimonas ignava]
MPALHVHLSHRPERLLALATRHALAPQLDVDPLAPRVWLVPSHGIAQWVQQSIAQHHGVCAGHDMRLPAQWLWQLYRSVLGHDAVPDEAPLDRGPLRWRLWRLLPTLASQPDADRYAPLLTYLGQGDPHRRAQLAWRIADLFDQYQIYRADWLDDWARGLDRLRDAEGRVREVPHDERWQPALWRLLRADALAEGHRWPSRSELHAAFVQRARALPAVPGVPPRLTVFGLNAITPDVLQALRLCARWCDVAMFIVNPSLTDWFDRVGAQAGHPLLAAWGRQGRDCIAGLHQLADAAPDGDPEVRLHEHFDDGTAADRAPAHLLAQLQDDILHGRAEGESSWPAVDPQRDGSLRMHIGHTPLREVEVLHDQVLAALQRDPTLQPRDIAVLVPDVPTYAPFVHAVWGSLPPHDPRHVPYTVSDTGDPEAQRLHELVRALLQLDQARWQGSQVLDWLDVPALAHAFDLQPDEVETLARWRERAGIRWALDAEHKQHLGLTQPTDPQAERLTWRDGLQRLWLGYALGDDEAVWADRALPARGVAVLQAPLLAKLQALVDALDAWQCTLRQPAPANVWHQRLHGMLDSLLAPTSDAERRTVGDLRSALDRWAQHAAAAGDDPIPAAVVADAWLALAAPAAVGQRFLAGGVTFATLMPMRSVPFRRVYLLGMHDGAYPRRDTPDAHDLMAALPRPGDRLRRYEDHYLFLEAVLAAREHLSISWVGRSPVDDTPAQPSLLVAQLRDHLQRHWRLVGHTSGDTANHDALLNALTTQHAPQPFAPANYASTPPADPAPPLDAQRFSYAAHWLASPPAAAGVAPAWERPAQVNLTMLADLLHDPVRGWTQQRLRIGLPDEEPDTDLDTEPFEPDGLQRWRAELTWVQAAVRACMQGATQQDIQHAALDAWRRAQWSGLWPLGAAGEHQRRDADERLQRLVQHVQGFLTTFPQPCDARPRLRTVVEIPSSAPIPFDAVLPAVRRSDDGRHARLVVQGSRLLDSKSLNSKRWRLAALWRVWVEHVALQLALGATATCVVSPMGNAWLRPVDTTLARDVWQSLWEAWTTGLGPQPLPLPRHAAAAYFQALRSTSEPGTDARLRAWDQAREAYEDRGHGLARDALWRRHYPTFEALAGPREAHDDRPFARWTERIVQPLRAHVASSLDTPTDGDPPDDA